MIDEELNSVPEPSLSEPLPPDPAAEDAEENAPVLPADPAVAEAETAPENTGSAEDEKADGVAEGPDLFEEEDEDYKPEPPKPDYLKMTLETRVMPLEMRFSQINSTYKKAPFAYRSFTYVNSVIDGVISPERYSFAADQTEQGIRLSRWNIAEAAAAVKKLTDAGRKIEFVTARVSPKIVDQIDFYAYIKEFADACGVTDYSKLCLEFPRTVLFEDPEKVRAAVLAMKLLKMKSMLTGCGANDSAITPLLDIPFDYVMLAPSLAYRLDDRGKKDVMEAFLSFLRLLGCNVIAENVINDKQIDMLLSCDCCGYIPSPEYSGHFEHGRLRMPLDEALLQSDGEEAF